MEITIAPARTAGDILGIQKVRIEVFVKEQDVALDLEIDDKDFEDTTIHIKMEDAGQVIGAARITADQSQDQIVHLHFGRIAILPQWRGQGLGAVLLKKMEEIAWQEVPNQGQIQVELSAQEYAIGFYERCGYVLLDRPHYLDAGIFHRDMAKTLHK